MFSNARAYEPSHTRLSRRGNAQFPEVLDLTLEFLFDHVFRLKSMFCDERIAAKPGNIKVLELLAGPRPMAVQ